LATSCFWAMHTGCCGGIGGGRRCGRRRTRSGFGFRVSGFGFRVRRSEPCWRWVWGFVPSPAGLAPTGLGGLLGFRVSGFGFRVSGFGNSAGSLAGQAPVSGRGMAGSGRVGILCGCGRRPWRRWDHFRCDGTSLLRGGCSCVELNVRPPRLFPFGRFCDRFLSIRICFI